MSHWISNDIAMMLKEAADPITYGRLLRVAKVFSARPSEPQHRRKLNELLESLPSSDRPQRPRNAYIFYSKEHREELKFELPDLTPAEVRRQITLDWFRIKNTPEAERWRTMAAQDKLRYDRERDADTWRLLMRRKQLVVQSLVAHNDEDSVMRVADKIRCNKRRAANAEVWQEMRGQRWPGMPVYNRQRAIIYKRRKVPKPGRSAYAFFLQAANPVVRSELAQNADEPLHQYRSRVMREIGRRWTNLSPPQRKIYDDLSRQDKLKVAKETVNSVGGSR